MVNKVDHTSRPKVLGITCNHRWWYFSVLLNSSHQDLLNDISDVVIKVSIFFHVFFFFLSYLSLFNHVSINCTIWVADNNYNLRIRYVISNSLNYIISWIFITLCYSMNFLFLRQNPKENRFRCLQLIICAYVKSYDISWLMM